MDTAAQQNVEFSDNRFTHGGIIQSLQGEQPVFIIFTTHNTHQLTDHTMVVTMYQIESFVSRILVRHEADT